MTVGDAPDPEGAAAAVLNAGGASDGPASRVRSTPEQRAQWRAEKKRQRVKAGRSGPIEDLAEERPPYHPDPVSIAGMATLGRTVWAIIGSRLGFRPLTDEEANTLGTALDPVAYKYAPFFGQYGAEINLVVVLFGLAQATKIKKPVEPEVIGEKVSESSASWVDPAAKPVWQDVKATR